MYKPTRPVSVLLYIFQNKDQELFSKFRLTSTWLPQPTYLPSVAKGKTAPPLVFKTIHTPHIQTRHLKKALIKHWNIIAGDPQLFRLFPDRPIIAYKRAPDLKDLLVKSRLTHI